MHRVNLLGIVAAISVTWVMLTRDRPMINAAIEKAGYGAEIVQDDVKRRERHNKKVAVANMKRASWR